MKEIMFYDQNQYKLLKEKIEDAGKSFYSMSTFLSFADIDQFDEEEIIIDLSSVVALLRNNDAQLYSIEILINRFSDHVEFVCDRKYYDDCMYILRHCFSGEKHLCIGSEIIPHRRNNRKRKSQIRKITDLKEDELQEFFDTFNKRLFGHNQFKEEFRNHVRSFQIFNKIGEHKVLSLLLMGDSGVGKTEVARSIQYALKSKTKMAKLNFGNYSSHDALNSLIGSPRGYIGSEDGELMMRVKASDVGLILIDEFEKADIPVFNYFLDVLENGKIVNSLGEEIDIDGYIIIFTSNIKREDYYKRFSQELRSRLDYKGIFNLLTSYDKNKFLRFRVNEILGKYRNSISKDIPKGIEEKIISQIDVNDYKDMRNLNNKIKEIFVHELN